MCPKFLGTNLLLQIFGAISHAGLTPASSWPRAGWVFLVWRGAGQCASTAQSGRMRMGGVWALETQGLRLKPASRIYYPDGLEQAFFCFYFCSFNKYLLNLGKALFYGLGI